ncbi:MAG: NADH-quinone oxidoreductase subunit NuoN [candidate division Zixibacteria bacterium]|nr:NADH-quinone oxidoreductase subunit NuoN [candidate division Zixibacteria bacterium]
MQSAYLNAPLPYIILAAVSLMIIIAISIKRNHAFAMGLSVIGMIAAFITLFTNDTAESTYGLLVFGPAAQFFTGLFLSSGIVIAFLGYDYLYNHDEHREEFYPVLLLAILGASVLSSSINFVSFFLGLELMTVSLYVMIAYLRDSSFSLEAGVKYLILAAASSAFLLMGMAFLYFETGSLEFTGPIVEYAQQGWQTSMLFLAGLAFMLVGIGFKLAVVPFHMWTADVYEGAPAPVTAFVATVSKGAVVAVLLRLFFSGAVSQFGSVVLVLSIIAGASMFAGNILALMQKNVKRILAYSSIAHLGYILVALLAYRESAVSAISYYLVVYFITTLGAFGLVSLLSNRKGEPTDIDSFRGIFWRQPLIAIVFTAMLMSLAGIPLTGGFIGKFMVVVAGVESSLWALIIILIVNSAIGIYYYLRIVAAMFSDAPKELDYSRVKVPFSGQMLMTILTVLLIYFGIFPDNLLSLIDGLVDSFILK